MTARSPEQTVVDEINALVDWQLAQGESATHQRIPWGELRPYEKQQGGYWLHWGMDEREWLAVARPADCRCSYPFNSRDQARACPACTWWEDL